MVAAKKKRKARRSISIARPQAKGRRTRALAIARQHRRCALHSRHRVGAGVAQTRGSNVLSINHQHRRASKHRLFIAGIALATIVAANGTA